ncbi:Transposase IS3/IS911family [Oxalobacteraceae bacterium]
MKKPRFTECQMGAILEEGGSGIPVAEVCRKHGISAPTYYQWKSKYAGMLLPELKRAKEPQTQHAKLKRMYAVHWRTLRIRRTAPKVLAPTAKLALIDVMVNEHRLSRVKACKLIF